MKLNEKILYCRKKAGLSQEMFAEKMGVSRQAVSKWETGDSQPEVSKITPLAKLFGVSTDWLLSEDEPEAEENGHSEYTEYKQESSAGAGIKGDEIPSWMDALPGFIVRLYKRFGWIYGIYLAIGGALFTLLGVAAKLISGSMMNSFGGFGSGIFPGDFSGSTMFIEGIGYVDPSSFGIDGFGGSSFNTGSSMFDPVSAIATVIIIIGIVMMIGGTALALYLKKKSAELK